MQPNEIAFFVFLFVVGGIVGIPAFFAHQSEMVKRAARVARERTEERERWRAYAKSYESKCNALAIDLRRAQLQNERLRNEVRSLRRKNRIKRTREAQ